MDSSTNLKNHFVERSKKTALGYVFGILLFGVSLQSHYFYSLSLPLFSLLSTAMISYVIILSNRNRVVLDKTFYQIYSFYLALLVWSFMGLLISLNTSFDVKRLAGIGILLFTLPFMTTLINKYSVQLMLQVALGIHFLFFFSHILLYTVFDLKIDFLQPFTGEEQRFYGGSFVNPLYGVVYRPGGLFNEPGTYATYMAPLIALFAKYTDLSKLNKILYRLGVLSLVMTSSVYGIAFAVVIILYNRRISKASKVMAVGLASLMVVPYFIYRFVERRLLGLNDGWGERVDFLTVIINYLSSSIPNFAFGSNLLASQLNIQAPITYNDIGFIFYMLFFLGVPFTLFVLFYVFRIYRKTYDYIKAAIVIILMSKISMFSVIFLYTIAIILYLHNSDRVR